MADKTFSEKNKEAFKNIVAGLAAAEDGLDDDERDYITDIATEWGMDADETTRLLDDPASAGIATVPDDIDERHRELAALIGMMVVDGTIYDEEMQFCMMVADKYGIEPGMVNDIITDILEGGD